LLNVIGVVMENKVKCETIYVPGELFSMSIAALNA
jgi:hypothetical protein